VPIRARAVPSCARRKGPQGRYWGQEKPRTSDRESSERPWKSMTRRREGRGRGTEWGLSCPSP
jgi:hypothetical protein